MFPAAVTMAAAGITAAAGAVWRRGGARGAGAGGWVRAGALRRPRGGCRRRRGSDRGRYAELLLSGSGVPRRILPLPRFPELRAVLAGPGVRALLVLTGAAFDPSS